MHDHVLCNNGMTHAMAVAVEFVGGVTKLAAMLGLSVQRVSNWRSRRVPAEYCPAIERATGGAVRCEQLRPDIDWVVLRRAAPPVARLLAQVRDD